MVHRFGIRPNSGGKGLWRGGDGVVREIEVLQSLQVSMLSEVSMTTIAYTHPHSVRRGERGNRMVWMAESLGH
jgi:N-methylhydantoinase B/oxoprolinase/acetone carboxylase alpha subunit